MKLLRIATRQSALALWQAEHVAARLRAVHADLQVELVPMTTRGDQILDRPLAEIGGKGLFLKELEVAMLEGRADIVNDREEQERVDAAYRAKYVDPGSGAQATIFEPEADLYRVNVQRIMAWEYGTVANRTDWLFEARQ